MNIRKVWIQGNYEYKETMNIRKTSVWIPHSRLGSFLGNPVHLENQWHLNFEKVDNFPFLVFSDRLWVAKHSRENMLY